ncbi:MAG: 50S ribosomal protein L30 [Gammaproteobacteria bacterium]|nr:50S ribosomal protein L30 [Gammaproteobacteria bacterium]
MAESKKLQVTLVKSMNGRLKKHQACARGLGLRRMHHTVEVIDTPENRGMINRISYMLKCVEI